METSQSGCQGEVAHPSLPGVRTESTKDGLPPSDGWCFQRLLTELDLAFGVDL